MMNSFYSQSVENPMPASARRKQILSLVMFVIAAGLILISFTVSYYALIAVGAVALAGAVFTSSYNKTIRKFTYDVGEAHLIFSSTNVLGKTQRSESIAFSQVTKFSYFSDIVEVGDLIMCPAPNAEDVCAISFNNDNGIQRVLFQPDDYLRALLAENLASVRLRQGESL